MNVDILGKASNLADLAENMSDSSCSLTLELSIAESHGLVSREELHLDGVTFSLGANDIYCV